MIRKAIYTLILGLLAATAPSISAQEETILQIPEADVALNQMTTVDILLNCPASNCIGIDVSISFDANIIQIDEIMPGDFLGDSPRITFSGVDSDGTLRLAALASARTERPAEGVIFSIALTGLSLGETELTVTNLSVFRRGGTVQATAENGSVRVSADAGQLPTALLARRLTVRSGPGPQFDMLGSAEANIELTVLGVSEDGAWYLIALLDETQGWIPSSRFVNLTGDVNLLPIVTELIEVATEAVEELSTLLPTTTSIPTDTQEPADTEVATTSPTDTEAPASPEPSETEAQPSATSRPTNTLLPPTSTLRTDAEAGIAPPATETPIVTDTAAPTVTDTPEPTSTPSPTDTPEPTPTYTPTIPEPCTLITTNTNVPVYVGPNRAIRTTFPANQIIGVTGQQQADDGSLWWRIEPLGDSQEVDRFWVRQSDVTAQGGCDIVEDASSPQVISGGGGSGQFASTFRSGQTTSTHNFSITSAGTYAVTCSGTPTYPEFGVGSTRSRGQTTIILNLTPGNYTLTVFASTLNAVGQPISISSYNCQLSRR